MNMIKNFNQYINEDLKITGEYEGKPEELNYSEEDLINAAKNCSDAKAFVKHITYGSTNETDTLSKEDQKKLTDWFNNHKWEKSAINQSTNEAKALEKTWPIVWDKVDKAIRDIAKDEELDLKKMADILEEVANSLRGTKYTTKY